MPPNQWGVTHHTYRLLTHWRDPTRDEPLFFCQVEAAETVIWLTEVAPRLGKLDMGKRLHALNAERPVLRLYGPLAPSAASRPASSSDVLALPGPTAPAIVAAPPVGALDRLPVMLTPGGSDSVPAIPDAPIIVAAPSPTHAAPSVEGPVELSYREALAHVSAYRFGDALASLSAFVLAHPDHPYADNAMYWRGEVLYAEREYAAA